MIAHVNQCCLASLTNLAKHHPGLEKINVWKNFTKTHLIKLHKNTPKRIKH